MKLLCYFLIIILTLCTSIETIAQNEEVNSAYITRFGNLSPNIHKDRLQKWQVKWFVFTNAGLNSYWSDYTEGSLSTRLTPQLCFGGGVWVSPKIGLSVQFTGFESKADKFAQGIFTVERPRYAMSDGRNYWKEYTKWIDLGINLYINLTRIIFGYEGDNSQDNMNQIIISPGIGATHHYSLPYGSANEFSGHLELGYSRFFEKKKDISLDVRLRALFYDSAYDGINDGNPFDVNLSINVGVTYTFDIRKKNTNNLRNKIDITESESNSYRLSHSSTTENIIIPKTEASSVLPFMISFQHDRINVNSTDRFNLARVARYINNSTDKKIIISGYPDQTDGSHHRSLWLAEHRALNISKILIEEFYVSPERLIIDNQAARTDTTPLYLGCAVITESK